MIQSTLKSKENDAGVAVGREMVNKKYTIIHKLHEGPNSTILVGAFMKSNRQVSRAIKIQSSVQNTLSFYKKNVSFGIKNEINVLRHIFMNDDNKLDLRIGFPHMYQYGTQDHLNYIVLNMYGPSLTQLMKLCGGRFSKRTTLLVGLQIVDRLEDLHNKRYLYGAMKPQNFVIGTGKQSFLVYMIDFSKCIVYKSKSKNVHIPYQHTNIYEHPCFDHNFTSVNCQLGVQCSRRDDIQSMMYLILFMFKGKLPWVANQYDIINPTNQNFKEGDENGENKNQNYSQSSSLMNLSTINPNILQQRKQRILEIKRKLTPQSLFKGISFELIDLMYYVKTLSFYEKPDYIYIRKKLWGALMQTDYEELRNNIIIYDWNQRQELDYEIYRDSPKFKLKCQKKEELDLSDKDSDKGSQQQLRKSNGQQVEMLDNSKYKKKPANRTSVCKKLSTSGKSNTSNQSEQKMLSKKDQINEGSEGENLVQDEENESGDQSQNKFIQQKVKIVNEIDESFDGGVVIDKKLNNPLSYSRFKKQ